MGAQPLDELFAGHAGPWTEQEWAALPESMGRVNEPGLDAVIVEPDPVALVVEVTSPSNAWVDRLVKPDAYARAGIPCFLRVDLDRTGTEPGATSYSLATNGFVASARAAGGRLTLERPFPIDLDLVALTTATRGPKP